LEEKYKYSENVRDKGITGSNKKPSLNLVNLKSTKDRKRGGGVLTALVADVDEGEQRVEDLQRSP